MLKLTEQIRDKIPYDLFTVVELKNLIGISSDSRYGIIKRAVANGELIKFRRGLYGLSKKYQRHKVNLYALAQKIYYPSYISLESSLSFHGWIPEAVYLITSASLSRSKEFRTPLGVFNYMCHPKFNLIGVERIEEKNEPFLMATPTKAIIDYVFLYKKDWRGVNPLTESLRIEEDNLKEISDETLLELMEFYKSKRVTRFIKGLRKDLKL